MNRDQCTSPAFRKQIPPFVLGTLDEDACDAVRRHATACAACTREIRALRETVSGIADRLPAEAPPPDLKARLLAKLKRRETPSVAATRTVVHSDERDWQPGGLPGVFVNFLHTDHQQQRCTMLVRMEPGTSYPAHIHAGPEELFVLEGDFSDALGTLRAGDYQRVEGNTRHGLQTTEAGCMLLVNRSLDDRFVTALGAPS